MKQIYIVLTNTGTVLSKIIRAYTKDEFAHVSISLDKELQEMYSFGRLNPYNAFVGGFIHEYIDKGTFNRFHNTKAKITCLDIEDEKYEMIRKLIIYFDKEKNKFKFNIWGLLGVGFNIKYKKENYFYCAEFVQYIFEKSNIDFELPKYIRPENFKDLPGQKVIFKGFLREYKVEAVV